MSALPPEQPPMWPDLTHLLRGRAWDIICRAEIGHARNAMGLMSADEDVEPSDLGRGDLGRGDLGRGDWASAPARKTGAIQPLRGRARIEQGRDQAIHNLAG